MTCCRPGLRVLLTVLFASLLSSSSQARPAAPPVRVRIGAPEFWHGGPVRSVVFGPKGDWLASASDDRTVSVWEVPSGRELFRLSHDSRVVSVSASGDGKLLASGTADGTVRLWSLEGTRAGQEVHQFLLPGEPRAAVAFCPRGNLLAATGQDGIVHAFDTRDYSTRWRSPSEGDLLHLAWSPDGSRLAGARVNGPVTLWDTKGKVIRRLREAQAATLAFSPDGAQLAGWDTSGAVEVWDAGTGKRLAHRQGEPSASALAPVLFAPDGKTLLVGEGLSPIRSWDLAGGKVTDLPTGGHGRILALALSPDGRWLALAGADHSVRLWDRAGRKLAPRAGLDGAVASASLSPDGRTLALVTAANTLTLWEVPGGKPLPVPEPLKVPLLAVAFRPDGKTLGVITADTRELQLRQRANGKLLSRSAEKPLAQNLAYSPDGGLAVTVAEQEGVLVFRSGASCLLRKAGQRERLRGAVFSPDGRTVVGIGSPAAIPLWDAEGVLQTTLPGHRGGLLAAAFSPDGRTLVSGGKDQVVRVWELASGMQRRAIPGQGSPVCAVAVSPDGRTLAAGTSNGVVRLWEMGNGRPFARFEGHRGAIRSLSFTPGGKILLSTGEDATAFLWSLEGLHPPSREATRLTKEQREVYWNVLAGADADLASQALDALSWDPAGTVPFLRDNLSPVDARKVAAWLAQLDDDSYQVRDQAARDLARLGRSLESALRAELKKKPALEKHRRIEELLRRMEQGPSGESLRALRSLEVLEQIGTPEARGVLRKMAEGYPEAEMTRQAREALRRLGK